MTTSEVDSAERPACHPNYLSSRPHQVEKACFRVESAYVANYHLPP